MAFTRDDLAAYESQPETQIPDPPAAPVQEAEPASSAVEAQTTDPDALGDGTSDAPSESSTETNVDPDDAPAETTEEIPAEETPPEPPKKGSARERIQELADERDGYKEFGKHLIEQHKAALSEIEKLKAQIAPAARAETPPATEPPSTKFPQLDDPDVNFDPAVLAKKQEAWFAKKIEQGVEEKLAATTSKKAAETLAETFQSRVESFKKETPDWKAIVENPALPQLAGAASAVILTSELGPKILYALGKDIGLAQRIAKMSPELQAAQIGKLEATIELAGKTAAGQKAPVGQAKPAPKKSVSNAPPPPTPTPAGNRAQERELTDPGLDMEEFARRHRMGRNAAREANRKARGLR